MGHCLGISKIVEVDYPFIRLDKPVDENWSNGLYKIIEHVSKESIEENFHVGDYIFLNCQESEDYGMGWGCKVDSRQYEYASTHDWKYSDEFPKPSAPKFDLETAMFIPTDIQIGVLPRFRKRR